MNETYPIVIIGGGIAGLSLAILSAKSNRRVLLLEKGHFPRQKVCGEYISNESYDFLLKLGVPLNELQLPQINQFVLTSKYGQSAETKMETGGFGLSRFYLDNQLYTLALESGVQVLTETKVNAMEKAGDLFRIKTSKGQTFRADCLVGAYGRVSGFNTHQNKKSEKYVGVKYHVDAGPDDSVIEIHHFNGGYCGISKVENGAYNLCYLAKADALKKYNGDIDAFEKHVLNQNPKLRERLKANRLFEPVITSQIQFGTGNSGLQNHLSIGDAAGFIPPITGNGISLALRSAKILHRDIESCFIHGNKSALLKANQHYIKHYLRHRIRKGIFLQQLLFIQNKTFNKILFSLLMYIPGLMKMLTKQAVGKKI